MIRFIHTADWQLGAGFPGKGQRAEELRKARLRTVRRILELARSEHVDFIIVAGDAFDNNRVGKALLYEVKQLLGTSPCPVFILPGNHDPLEGDSIYTVRDEWRELPGEVRILREAAPVRLDGVTLYPCPCKARVYSQDPTAWIPPRRPEDGIRIGIAHGSWQVLPDLPLDDHPIPPSAAGQRELDYLALGHWHSVYPDPKGQPSGRTFYSGTPEPTAFGEDGSGFVLVVTIEQPNAAPQIEPRRVAEFTWMQQEAALIDEGSVKQLRNQLAGIPERALVRLRLRGTIRAPARHLLQSVLDEARARLFWLEVDDSELATAVEQAHMEALPSELLRRVGRRLKAYAEGAEEPPEVWHPDAAMIGESTSAPVAAPSVSAAAVRALELLWGRVGRPAQEG
ncbi:MAG: DNA repair exonuclease [Bacillota bacterium]